MFKRHRWLSLILLLVIILALTMIVLSLIPGSTPGRSVLAEMFGLRAPSVAVSELNFDVGRNRDFAHANGHVAAVGTLGLQVLGPDGQETLRESTRFTSPVLIENSGRFLAFDIGSSSLRVFTAQSMLSSIDTELPIISASINKNGWFCVAVQEQTGGYLGTVYVYNNRGRPVYKVSLGSGFVLTAALSDDNNNLAILNIAETGTRVNLYSGIDEDKNYADDIFELGNSVFFDIKYLSNTKVLAAGAESFATIDFSSNTPVSILYSFEDKRLGGYACADDFIALHLYDYNIGFAGQVITLGYDGTQIAAIDSEEEIVSISSSGSTLVMLSAGGVRFYTRNLEAYPPSQSSLSAAASGRVFALEDSLALVASDLSVTVVRRED